MKIPKELYDSWQIRIPTILANVYIGKLELLGKLEESKLNKKEIGGIDAEETIEHFVYRFPNGAARAEYAVINPDKNISDISSHISTIFSDKELCILYLPCGSGAGLLGLLSTLVVLRKNKCHPTLPLNIKVIGADFSDTALEIFLELIDELAVEYIKQGIKVTSSVEKWDATNTTSTTALMHKFFDNSADEYFVFFSNFSGAAGNSNDFDASFQVVMDFVSTRYASNTSILWIEPGNYSKATKLLSKLPLMLDRATSYLKSIFKSAETVKNEDIKFKWLHPTSKTELSSSISCIKFAIDGQEIK